MDTNSYDTDINDTIKLLNDIAVESPESQIAKPIDMQQKFEDNLPDDILTDNICNQLMETVKQQYDADLLQKTTKVMNVTYYSPPPHISYSDYRPNATYKPSGYIPPNRFEDDDDDDITNNMVETESGSDDDADTAYFNSKLPRNIASKDNAMKIMFTNIESVIGDGFQDAFNEINELKKDITEIKNTLEFIKDTIDNLSSVQYTQEKMLSCIDAKITRIIDAIVKANTPADKPADMA